MGGLPVVYWTPDRAVQVQALAAALHCVLGQDTLLFPSNRGLSSQHEDHTLKMTWNNLNPSIIKEIQIVLSNCKSVILMLKKI